MLDKIIITNRTDLDMRIVVKAVHELLEYPIEPDTMITYGDGEYYCYIKENKESINFIFGERVVVK